MPSQLFLSLAQSQLELLDHSLPARGATGRSKIGSMALYLPQENVNSGQLEFLPAVLYPHPSSERVFIASDADSGVAPSLPKTLTKLPGFAHAATLLPGYPMVPSSTSAGVGVVEEVLCDTRSGAAALSIPLFSGSQTVGVLLVWPSPQITSDDGSSVWTEEDKNQILRAAQSLSLALSMDTDRKDAKKTVDRVRDALSDSLHQVKNPIQALRTFGKLLQQRVASSDTDSVDVDRSSVSQLLALAQHLIVQSDRVADLILPIDSLVNSLDTHSSPFYLTPYEANMEEAALAKWRVPPSTSWRNHTVDVDIQEKSKRELEDESIVPFASEEINKTFPQMPLSTIKSGQSHAGIPTTVGDVVLEMSFITDVLDPILAGYKAIAADRNIVFDIFGATEELPGVLVCPKSLQEAVSNVLDNAFKYVQLQNSEKSGQPPIPHVRVRIVANREPDAAGVTVFVEDNGPGILPEERDDIFERGFRSRETMAAEGSGLGLNISRALVSRMGGILEVGGAREGTLSGTVMKFVLFRQPIFEDKMT